MRTCIFPSVPGPNGHYSHAVVFNGAVYLSGILPNAVSPEAALEDQFHAVFSTIESILAGCGSALSQTVLCRIYVAELRDWPEINRLYAERFGEHRPARVVVPVKELHFGYRLEVELMAQAGHEHADEGGCSKKPL